MKSIMAYIEVTDTILHRSLVEHTLRCGIHTASVLDYGEDVLIVFQIGENLFRNELAPSLEGLSEGVWNWLCTLDRATDDGRRHLPNWFDTPFCKVSEGA